MIVNLRLPSITAQDTAGQLRQLRSYLHQLVDELNVALPQVESRSAEAAAQIAAAATGGGARDPNSAQEAFSSIKSLIIKSADIVDAYYESISRRLEGQYVAQSTFGTFSEETSQQIRENSTEIQRAFTNIQQVESNVDEIETTLIGVNAYINSGHLYDDSNGVPVYGIEVGQRTEVNGEQVFNKYARFTANKLSFYDSNDNEVAFISDYKLYISNVEITGSHRIGYLVETVQSDGSVVTKYVRGD